MRFSCKCAFFIVLREHRFWTGCTFGRRLCMGILISLSLKRLLIHIPPKLRSRNAGHFPVRSQNFQKNGLQIDKSIFFLKIMLAFLQMCIFCCTFAASFAKRTQKQINLIKNKKLMKQINFWVATLFMALLPILFTSCNSKMAQMTLLSLVNGKWKRLFVHTIS